MPLGTPAKPIYFKAGDNGQRQAYVNTLDDYTKPENASLTIQEAARDTDINELARRFGVTQLATIFRADDPAFYGDASAVPRDLNDAYEQLRDANTKFNMLDANIREKFGNNYREYVSWVNDEKNYEEAINLGLLSDKAGKAFQATKAAREKAAQEANAAFEARVAAAVAAASRSTDANTPS